MAQNNHTLVVTGNDPTFAVDLSAFRGVREETGMTFTRLKNPTIKDLESHLRRLRMAMGGDLPNIHIGAHMGPNGVEFQDGTIAPERMSELFAGAPVMFLAGCEGIGIADALSAIPYVLSMIEKISNEDALAFSLLFWASIGHGYSPSEGFAYASESLPSVAEYAYLHANHFLAPRERRK